MSTSIRSGRFHSDSQCPCCFLRDALIWLLALHLACAAISYGWAPVPATNPLPAFDFRQPAGAQGWSAQHDLGPLESSAAGLVLRLTGSDPYLAGPPRDYPPDVPLWLNLRLKSEEGGGGQVFYFKESARAGLEVSFAVEAGVWETVRVPMPALGPGYRMRLDPPGERGACVVERMWFEERVAISAPTWPAFAGVTLGEQPCVVVSRDLQVRHSRTEWGCFEVEAAGERAAVGQTRALLCYVLDGKVCWSPMARGPGATVRCFADGLGLRVDADWTDPDGARWAMRQTFRPGGSDAIRVDTTVQVDRERAVAYLPVFTLFPGVGSHGTNKHQGLFAGVEYLENEPSSSEADVEGPDAWRLVPDTLKLTFPLMALQAGRHYVGLMWEPQAGLCAVHDSPDRQFHSGGHLMGLLMPGSDGLNREERSLMPYAPRTLRAGEAWQVQAIVLGGSGSSVVPAVQRYVALRGLPALPVHGFNAERYHELAARGWLDSRIREDTLYRHAVWPGFNAQPASDAALWMRWLAGQPGGAVLAPRLKEAADAALGRVSPGAFNASQIGHNRRPLPALVFGAVEENAAEAARSGRALLGRFEGDGTVLYRAGSVDYARTHWSREANGLAAPVVSALLEAGLVSGDRAVQDAGLRHLRALRKFQFTVPRGAQTWEVPLHTPDILASAHLVQAYALGYELSGDPAFLEEARYWAWTGVPFVYLTPPVEKAVGLYGTIPVLGATGWKAPVWLGRPVQWCGLAYAEALYQFEKHDPAGPWRQIADGIVAAGLQHTWPMEDAERRGLLPDFYLLRNQRRDGPAINPATLLVPALEFFGSAPPYTRRMCRQAGLIVHAPGTLADVQETEQGVSFRVLPWSDRPSFLLVNGWVRPPRVQLDGQSAALTSPHHYNPDAGRVVVQIQGPTSVELLSAP